MLLAVTLCLLEIICQLFLVILCLSDEFVCLCGHCGFQTRIIGTHYIRRLWPREPVTGRLETEGCSLALGNSMNHFRKYPQTLKTNLKLSTCLNTSE